MEKLKISIGDLLKDWSGGDLYAAMIYAQKKTLDLNPTSGEYKMWLTRQLAYRAEIKKRAN